MILLQTKRHVLKLDKYHYSQGWGARIYRNEYPYTAPTKEFEAVAVRLGHRILWLFTKEALRQWPSAVCIP